MAQKIQNLERSGPAERAERHAPGKRRAWAKRFRVSTARVQRFGVGRWLALALLAMLVALRSWDPLPVETLRLRTFDLYQFIQPREAAFLPVAIVDLDDLSTDFEDETELIVLDGDLQVSDLTISDGGTAAGTAISVTATGEILSVLQSVTEDLLTADDFTTIM